MRQQWDERATIDAFHYIASWVQHWTPDEFFRSGEDDYIARVDPFLKKLVLDPEKSVALDLGCGAGRITRAIAARFRAVYAVDVSPKMLRLGRDFNRDLGNVLWICGPGTDLSMFRSGVVDFAFSYLVLQHVPQPEIALRNISELLRVLKPMGGFLFQFNSRRAPTMNWKGRGLWLLIDRLKDAGWENAARLVALAFGVNSLAAGSTWRGAVLEVRTVLEKVWASGGAVLGVEGWGTQMTWCWGCKRAWERRVAQIAN